MRAQNQKTQDNKLKKQCLYRINHPWNGRVCASLCVCVCVMVCMRGLQVEGGSGADGMGSTANFKVRFKASSLFLDSLSVVMVVWAEFQHLFDARPDIDSYSV